MTDENIRTALARKFVLALFGATGIVDGVIAGLEEAIRNAKRELTTNEEYDNNYEMKEVVRLSAVLEDIKLREYDKLDAICNDEFVLPLMTQYAESDVHIDELKEICALAESSAGKKLIKHINGQTVEAGKLLTNLQIKLINFMQEQLRLDEQHDD